ncbi:mechanosensitive ion channel family protein [Acaricomes phytoseiuli]|uniref:mechanosensitive ion channel family protein n=1 Tax=Acaricomes phytoseiuli TaxID=291968 RepID=UPI0022235CC2|nr:mechanosensitive ion channel family protein [Acaricomes phytoseiuli]MCW1249974.1 mechanosensitive ion channel family protein [Acaricomes phytoseiuli]
MPFSPWLDAATALALGLIFWFLGRFVISRITRRLSRAQEPEQSPAPARTARWSQPAWSQPALRPWESERRVQRARTIGSLLTSVYGTVLVVITGVYVLLAFGVNVAPLLTSFGIIGVAIGFGCQQLIRDFLAGIFLTLEDQFGIGDVIETSEVVGTVESVNLRITRVRGEDGAIWYLRNGEILRVGNRSQGQYRGSGQYRDPGPRVATNGEEEQ